ncbi:MAG TPA: hypothetical protein VFP35_00290 [Candidatus Saccharimonadales bacterium]|nr:hypothetical protein [Candidatus Saccharimonadales bacterium]
MKQNDIASLIIVAFITAVFSFVVSDLLFGGGHHSSNVPTASSISTTFPDVKNDPAYNSIFNSGALDPAQPVQVGGSQNSQPFNGPSQ